MVVEIQPVTEAEAESWHAMRCRLWPEGSAATHRDEVDDYFAGRFPRWPWCALLARDRNGAAVGFAEVSLREHAEGCASGPVGYLEGWFVEAHARRAGVGRQLAAACERWAAARGAAEFASDAEVDNDVSARAHEALGFEEVCVVRCYRKPIGAQRASRGIEGSRGT